MADAEERRGVKRPAAVDMSDVFELPAAAPPGGDGALDVGNPAAADTDASVARRISQRQKQVRRSLDVQAELCP